MNRGDYTYDIRMFKDIFEYEFTYLNGFRGGKNLP
ncbi:hypothetical protein J2Z49_001585 [Desulfofundulus luciae]|uniref:IS5/IS1182 family transposase n=1 Tax=Desulfofundulus luciae TaxID=74702 RepID=A0ABU0B166_9FIRM|nr:hypothetical protein [Desulfofundulus luciae]